MPTLKTLLQEAMKMSATGGKAGPERHFFDAFSYRHLGDKDGAGKGLGSVVAERTAAAVEARLGVRVGKGELGPVCLCSALFHVARSLPPASRPQRLLLFVVAAEDGGPECRNRAGACTDPKTVLPRLRAQLLANNYQLHLRVWTALKPDPTPSADAALDYFALMGHEDILTDVTKPDNLKDPVGKFFTEMVCLYLPFLADSQDGVGCRRSCA